MKRSKLVKITASEKVPEHTVLAYDKRGNPTAVIVNLNFDEIGRNPPPKPPKEKTVQDRR